MARVDALANPELLRWARSNSGFTVDEVAKKIRVAPDRIEAWEGGFSHPTITQLRNLGRVYRRPIAVFFLPEPPGPGPKMLTDYRRIWGTGARVISPQLRGEIETAYDRRDIALELLELEGDTPIRFRLVADLNENPDAVARRVREALGISEGTQRAWGDLYAGLNAWRDAIERSGALVLQMTDVPSAEARGFSIASRPLPAVVANIHDAPRARPAQPPRQRNSR